jgi:hypothetical protein
MYDQDAEQIMLAAELGASDVRDWFDALCETTAGAHGEPPSDWATFKERLAEQAQSYNSAFDASFVRAFCTAVESTDVGDPLDTLREMSGRGPEELAAAYPTLLDQEASEDPVTLDWVTEAQRTRLSTEIGDHWPDLVRPKLSEVWPAWRESDPETLTGFLDQWMDTIVAETSQATGETTADGPDSLSWVTEAQQARLSVGIGGEWPDIVRAKLDEVWAPWRESDAATLTGFLDEWMDTIVGEAARATPMPGLDKFDEETQTVLVSDEGRATVDDLQRQLAEIFEANPEFAEIDPQRRQELILQVAAEKMGAGPGQTVES